jgi:transcriptional regulator with XRE-family HTH domain
MATGREVDTVRFPEYVWLAQNMIRLRLQSGLTQTELSQRLGKNLDQSYISAMERMRVNPTLEVLSAIAKALDVTVADLVAQPAD